MRNEHWIILASWIGNSFFFGWVTITRAWFWSYTHTHIKHRCVLPVLHYPVNMDIYHYPLIGVIFMVSLLIFIIQNYPNFLSKYYPKFTIRVIYLFIFNLGEFWYEPPFPQHYPIVREEKVIFSYFFIRFLIEMHCFLIRTLIKLSQ